MPIRQRVPCARVLIRTAATALGICFLGATPAYAQFSAFESLASNVTDINISVLFQRTDPGWSAPDTRAADGGSFRRGTRFELSFGVGGIPAAKDLLADARNLEKARALLDAHDHPYLLAARDSLVRIPAAIRASLPPAARENDDIEKTLNKATERLTWPPVNTPSRGPAPADSLHALIKFAIATGYLDRAKEMARGLATPNDDITPDAFLDAEIKRVRRAGAAAADTPTVNRVARAMARLDARAAEDAPKLKRAYRVTRSGVPDSIADVFTPRAEDTEVARRVLLELAVGYSDVGFSFQLDSTVDARGSLQELPSVTLYTTFQPGGRYTQYIKPYGGVRIGLLQLAGFRAFQRVKGAPADTSALAKANVVTTTKVITGNGKTLQLGGVIGLALEVPKMPLHVFGEVSWIRRRFSAIEWADVIPERMPHDLKFERLAVDVGLQVNIGKVLGK